MRNAAVAWTAVMLALAAVPAASRRQVDRNQTGKVLGSQQLAIDAYAAELKKVDSGTGISLEPLLATAEPLELLAWTLEELSGEEVKRISVQLRGLDIHIGDTVYAKPDPQFFMWLAERTGRPVDVEFRPAQPLAPLRRNIGVA
jgi:hypothetical protein